MPARAIVNWLLSVGQELTPLGFQVHAAGGGKDARSVGSGVSQQSVVG
jgi:hypothetical protein